MTAPTDARSALLRRAQRQALQCSQRLSRHREALGHLEATAGRVATLLADYQRRLAESHGRPRPMADTRNDHLFLQSLQAMADKLEQDVRAARAQRDAAARTLQESERTVLQARKLVELAAGARLAELERRLQKEADDWSSVQHAHRVRDQRTEGIVAAHRTNFASSFETCRDERPVASPDSSST